MNGDEGDGKAEATTVVHRATVDNVTVRALAFE